MADANDEVMTFIYNELNHKSTNKHDTTNKHGKVVDIYGMNNDITHDHLFINKFQVDDKQTVVMNVKQYLDDCDNAIGKGNKLKCAMIIFDYLCINKWFIREHYAFKLTVKHKLIELINHVRDDISTDCEYYKTQSRIFLINYENKYKNLC